MNGDVLNGAFELGGAVLMLFSVRALLRDKMVRGFSPAPMAFITMWGLWNLFYYPSLGQWLSFTGGVALVIMNSVQLALVWRYRNA